MRPQVLCQPVLHVFSQRTITRMQLKVFSLLRVCPYSLEVTEISHCVHCLREVSQLRFLCQIHNDMTACYKRFLIRKSNIFLCLYCLYCRLKSRNTDNRGYNRISTVSRCRFYKTFFFLVLLLYRYRQA